MARVEIIRLISHGSPLARGLPDPDDSRKVDGVFGDNFRPTLRTLELLKPDVRLAAVQACSAARGAVRCPRP